MDDQQDLLNKITDQLVKSDESRQNKWKQRANFNDAQMQEVLNIRKEQWKKRVESLYSGSL